jgi:hypothetical protein
MEEMRITARRDAGGELELTSYDAEMLFTAGNARLQRQDCLGAVELYDRLADEFPTSRYRSAALYNAGLCLGQTDHQAEGARRFERLLREAPESSDVKHAAFNLALLRVQLERWEEVVAIADELLAREDLTSAERVEAMARRSQGLLGAGRRDDAARQSRSALAYFRSRRGEDEIHDPLFAAIANFVLAETIREEAEAILIPEASIERQRALLERRAQLILDAQRQYFNTIGMTNAHWAAASGYRIGGMYDALWHAITSAPVPEPPERLPPGTEETFRQEYRTELARTITPLIRNAIRYWELTLLMVERTGVQNAWTRRLAEDLDRARRRLLAQPGIGPPASPRPPSDRGTAPIEQADGLTTPEHG